MFTVLEALKRNPPSLALAESVYYCTTYAVGVWREKAGWMLSPLPPQTLDSLLLKIAKVDRHC